MNGSWRLWLLALSLVFAIPAYSDEVDDLVNIEVPVEGLFVAPEGFDDNDLVEVVLHGHLRNACYVLSKYKVEKTVPNRIHVRQFARRKIDGICAEDDLLPDHLKMRVPFNTVVPIGQLSKGNYRFEFTREGNGIGMRSMLVAKATAITVDSLPYAGVEQVMAPSVLNGVEPLKVTLSGVLNSTCTELESNTEVRRMGDVIAVLPTVRVKLGVICAQVLVPFQKTLDLGRLTPGLHYLIHVRAMSGRSVNHVVLVAR